MFILRKITANGLQMNTAIGSNYNVVFREENPHEFDRIISSGWEDDSKIYGFVENFEHQIPLYVNHQNYIMSDSGKTFSNLTHRNYEVDKATNI